MSPFSVHYSISVAHQSCISNCLNSHHEWQTQSSLSLYLEPTPGVTRLQINNATKKDPAFFRGWEKKGEGTLKKYLSSVMDTRDNRVWEFIEILDKSFSWHLNDATHNRALGSQCRCLNKANKIGPIFELGGLIDKERIEKTFNLKVRC